MVTSLKISVNWHNKCLFGHAKYAVEMNNSLGWLFSISLHCWLMEPSPSCSCTTWNMQPPWTMRQGKRMLLLGPDIISAYNLLARTAHVVSHGCPVVGKCNSPVCPEEEIWMSTRSLFHKRYFPRGFNSHLPPIFAALVTTINEIHSDQSICINVHSCHLSLR